MLYVVCVASGSGNGNRSGSGRQTRRETCIPNPVVLLPHRYCFNKCDSLASQHQPNTTCAGFTLINATGAYLCAYYHSGTNLAPPNPPEKALVGFYAQSAKPAPAPAPAPPLPPPPAPPPPTPPAPRAPDQFTATLLTDVGTNEKIVLNLRRSDAPHGVDQFHRLAKM